VSDLDALIDAFQAAWPVKGIDRFEQTCHEDLHYEDPLLDDPLTGPRDLAKHADRLLVAFPDARIETTGPRMTSDRHVAAPCKLVAHHRGPLGDIPPTGRFIRVHGVVVCELHPDHDLLWRLPALPEAYAAGGELGKVPRRGVPGGKTIRMLRSDK